MRLEGAPRHGATRLHPDMPLSHVSQLYIFFFLLCYNNVYDIDNERKCENKNCGEVAYSTLCSLQAQVHVHLAWAGLSVQFSRVFLEWQAVLSFNLQLHISLIDSRYLQLTIKR